MKRTVPQTLAECQTDEQRADYLVKHDVFESDEFKYEGVANLPVVA